MGNKVPCMNCEFRTLGCHAKCERYQAYRASRDEYLEERNKKINVNDAMHAMRRRRKR